MLDPESANLNLIITDYYPTMLLFLFTLVTCICASYVFFLFEVTRIKSHFSFLFYIIFHKFGVGFWNLDDQIGLLWNAFELWIFSLNLWLLLLFFLVYINHIIMPDWTALVLFQLGQSPELSFSFGVLEYNWGPVGPWAGLHQGHAWPLWAVFCYVVFSRLSPWPLWSLDIMSMLKVGILRHCNKPTK